MCCRSALARRKEGQTTHLEMSGWVPLLSVDEARELERRGRREGKRDRRRKRRRDTHVGGRGGGRRGAREEGKGWRERGKEGGRRHACQHQYQNAYSSLIIEKTLERVYTSHFTLPPHPPTSPSLPTHALPHQSRVPDEEDGCVVSHKVPVSILGVKLHCKPTRIPHCVRTSRLTTCCMRGKMGKNGYAKLYAQRVHTNMSEAFKL